MRKRIADIPPLLPQNWIHCGSMPGPFPFILPNWWLRDRICGVESTTESPFVCCWVETPPDCLISRGMPMFNVVLGTREFNGHWVVAVRGELDLGDRSSVAAHLSAALAASGLRLIVDLAGPEYIDSSDLGVLARALTCARGSGDHRKCRRTCTRCGSAPQLRPLSRRAGVLKTPPARAIVRVPCRDPHDEKGRTTGSGDIGVRAYRVRP